MGPVTQLLPASILKQDTEHDLAVLDTQTIDFAIAQKEPFALATSALITQTFLEQQLGVLSFIWGAWGSKVEVVLTGQSVYVEVPIYSNGGSIKTVTPTTITAEFKEEEAQVLNDALFPQLRNTSISAVSRDLSGMSGSGLWLAGEARTLRIGTFQLLAAQQACFTSRR